jgi:hypothetical protein
MAWRTNGFFGSAAFLHIRSRVLSFRPAAVSGIFFAVDRCQMRRIFIEIRSANSKLLPVCIDIGRKPVAIAAAEAPAMVRPVGRRLQAAYDRLTVIIAERAGYARRQPRLLRRVKR